MHEAYYVAYGKGNEGDGERAHRHTVEQSILCLRGELEAVVGDRVYVLRPGESAHAPSGVLHGLLVTAPGTEYVSVFIEPDREAIDWARIRREQVPMLTETEIRERRKDLSGRRCTCPLLLNSEPFSSRS